MTDTDRIAQMAREAGLHINGQTSEQRLAACARFARLVAEDCAKVCDESAAPHPGEVHTDAQWCALHLSVAIRARYK